MLAEQNAETTSAQSGNNAMQGFQLQGGGLMGPTLAVFPGNMGGSAFPVSVEFALSWSPGYLSQYYKKLKFCH